MKFLSFLNPRPKPRRRPTVSQLLTDFLANLQQEHFTLAELLTALGPRAYGLAMIVFALPSLVLGGVPGVSTVISVPILLLALQLAIGLHRPWVPRFLANLRFEKRILVVVVEKIRPILDRIEFYLRPRLLWLTDRVGKHVIGLLMVITCIILMLPIFFGNFLPGFALILFGIGLIERDGLCVLGGLIFGLAATIYAVIFYGSLAHLFMNLVTHN